MDFLSGHVVLHRPKYDPVGQNTLGARRKPCPQDLRSGSEIRQLTFQAVSFPNDQPDVESNSKLPVNNGFQSKFHAFSIDSYKPL